MAITIDVKNDPLYKEGVEKGKVDVARQLLNSGEFTLSKIATMTGLPLATVEKLNAEMKKKK